MRFPRVLAALVGASLLGGCGDAALAPADPGDDAARAILQSALSSCLRGDARGAIVRLDTLVASRPDDIDARVTRGLCHHVRFAADSARADAERAMDDLTAALDRLADGGTADVYTLDRVYSHRAFVRAALAPGDWSGTVEDLEHAIRAAPDEPTHRLDLGVARSLAGDTTGAIADLKQFLVMAPTDSMRGAVVRRHLAALGDSTALPR